MDDLIEPHDPVPDCDCGSCARHERDLLRIALRIKTEEHDCCAEDLRKLRQDNAQMKRPNDQAQGAGGGLIAGGSPGATG